MQNTSPRHALPSFPAFSPHSPQITSPHPLGLGWRPPCFGTAQWAALSKSFAHLAEKGYPESMKVLLRQGGLDPDKITAMAKAAVAQQQAEQTSKLTIQMYHCNHLGTPIALINTQGMIDWAIELDPWGNVLNEFNPNNIDQPSRMQGQQIDRESGLFYNRHRYYDPNMGRYITQDPIGLAGGVNLYGYVNNPNQWVDPLGLKGKGGAVDAAKGTKSWYDKIKDFFDGSKEGAELSKESQLASCKADKARMDKLNAAPEGEEALIAQNLKGERGAQIVRDGMAIEASAALEAGKDPGTIGKVYGYAKASPADCTKLLAPPKGNTMSNDQFFKK